MEKVDVAAIIPNTLMKKYVDNGEDLVYEIAPADGYAIHNTGRDFLEEGNVKRGYCKSFITVPIDYDFENKIDIDGYEAYGNKKIFAIPLSEVDEKSLF